MSKPVIDRVGHHYGRLVVLGRAQSQKGNARWCCKCDCGFYTIANGNDLARGKVVSCGCWNYQKRIQHGLVRTPVYRAWNNLLRRCESPRNPSYTKYGGRGIAVCPEWHNFRNFFADMGHPPGKGYSIDRINNDGPYAPSNCRWAKIHVQANNTRRNRLITHEGRTQTIAQWARELGMDYDVIRSRLDRYGWPIARALNEPARERSKRNARPTSRG